LAADGRYYPPVYRYTAPPEPPEFTNYTKERPSLDAPYNRGAIVSLILAVVGVPFLPLCVALPSLGRIEEKRQKGIYLAAAAIILSIFEALLIVEDIAAILASKNGDMQVSIFYLWMGIILAGLFILLVIVDKVINRVFINR
jgi:uncharacterized membrane protein